jgi:predicted CXXCH cytochrome family protein
MPPLAIVKHLTLITWVLLILLSVNAQAAPHAQLNDDFVGSEGCAQCHQAEYKQWQTSHHAKSMMLPTAANVLGNFDNIDVMFNGISSRFTRNEAGYFITTQNASNKTQTYKVEYTFGYTPLQQYLLDGGDGKLQAFDIAWDSRAETAGGQRWFKLLANEDTSATSPFHWTKQVQNWNSRCAECHSTEVYKGYDPIDHTYDTRFSEVNVACESCHGAGKQHVGLVTAGNYKKAGNSGFKTQLKQTRQFTFNNSSPIAAPQGDISHGQINACGGCHSRRQVIGKIDPAHEYDDQFALRLLNDPLYHADGQIQGEVFVLGSFLQSKMHQAGVTCTNCHNAHTGEVKAQDNQLCTQCHKVETYDTQTHHQHQASSPGALCVNCHMPATTYMEVDDRRDHSFSIPRPQHSAALKTPNACNGCHKTQSSEWAAKAVQQWFAPTPDIFALINERARKGDVLALRNMTSFINDDANPAVKRATLLSLAGNIPSRLTFTTLQTQLSSANPKVRRAAVAASGFIGLAHRWSLLKALITDPVASVRHEVANQLAAFVQDAQGEDFVALSKLLTEYEQQLLLTQDTPGGQTSMALYAMNQGDAARALSALNKALLIEPDFVPALLNLADLYRAMANETKAQATFESALLVAPDSGALQHSFGLYWIRQKKMEHALGYLKVATQCADRNARFFYVYAVALEGQGKINEAITTLKQANKMWPNQYDLLITLIIYLEKNGKTSESRGYLSNLSAIAPNDPEVKRRLAEMRNQGE